MYSNLLNCDCVSEVPKKLHPEGTEEEKTQFRIKIAKYFH